MSIAENCSELPANLDHLLRLDCEMEPACLRHEELPNTSRLFSDFLYHHDRISKFYNVPGTPSLYDETQRPELVRFLSETNASGPSLDRLAQTGTRAVLTGQQVGLFSGPAYTIYKALSAIRMAEDLTRQGTPSVPVFWLATEDHDFAEINHTWVQDIDHQPVALRLEQGGRSDQPVGTIASRDWPIDALTAALRSFPHAGDVIARVRESYQSGRTLGESFQALLQSLLAGRGLLFIDPMRPGFRRLAAPLLRSVLASASDLNARLLARNKELESAGYHAQVHVESKTSLVFLLAEGRRIALRRQNGNYLGGDSVYRWQDLADRAEDLSPNAILRPVVQDAVLPTIAYVGGPAELAYFAQSQVIYQDILGRIPQLMSRSGFTLLDHRSAKLMEKFRLRVPDFAHGEEALREKVAAAMVPADLQGRFSETRAAVTKLVDHLTAGVERFDPTLGASLVKSRSKILHQLAKSEAKTAREMLRRNSKAEQDARYLYNSIFPHKHLQERFYSILPFLAQHGLDLTAKLYENVHLDCSDHILLPV